jgi:zinc transport system substrate-binding protein
LKAVTLLAGLFALAVAAPAESAEVRPVVFVSIPPQAWLVKRLAGEAVEVQALLVAGANPHTFEPGARQIKKLSEASLFLTLGLPFERPLVGRAAALNPRLAVAAADAGIAKLGAHEHGHAHEPGHLCCAEGGDPHIWLSPRLFAAVASNTVQALAQALPLPREALSQKLAETLAEIGAADRAARAAAQAMRAKTWVVYHPSWSYFAQDYGLSLLVIEEDGKAPSARHLAEVIGQARAAGVRTVFAEAQYDARPARTLAAQLGAAVATLDPLQEDWPALMRDVAAKLAQ